MRVGTFWYCLKEGIKNIGKNIWFSLASVAVVSACIFLFCIFFSLVANVRYMVKMWKLRWESQFSLMKPDTGGDSGYWS